MKYMCLLIVNGVMKKKKLIDNTTQVLEQLLAENYKNGIGRMVWEQAYKNFQLVITFLD